MNNFDINKVEDINITLDTILGLSITSNDLINQNIQLLANYQTKNKETKKRIDRLSNQLLALSNAITSTTINAQKQVEEVVNTYYKNK
jgi:hypothetical protein